MASVTSESGVSLLPLIAYAVLATLLAYLGLWMYRHLRSNARARFALPKPVSGSSSKSSILGHSTGWNWRRWTLPRVPTWSSVPDTVLGKAKAVANAKNLNVELLPTTALPPPPTSLPTPSLASLPATTQLIDISTPPATPPLTTGSTSGSFPMSPRTPSPPFLHYLTPSKPLYQSPMFTSYSRSPSPLSNLATYPQKSHRRSKSLGGVPIRRLSGGSSGLRNAMEMQDFSPTHTRGTSREHLLIDLASSSSSDEDENDGVFAKISPAASDIGILPAGKEVPPRVDARTVGRHVPLVDLDDNDAEHTRAPGATTNEDEEGWKWFISSKIPASQSGLFSGLGPQSTAQSEQLVDMSEKRQLDPVPAPEDVIVALRRMELEDHRDKKLVDINLRPGAPLEAESKENVIVDLQDNYLDDEDLPLGNLALSLNITAKDQAQITEPIRSRSPESPLVVKAAFSHPLETLVDIGMMSTTVHGDVKIPSQHDIEEGSLERPSLLFQHDPMGNRHHGIQESQSEVVDPFADPVGQTSIMSNDLEQLRPPSPSSANGLVNFEEQTVPEVWAWDEGIPLDDPWANHLPSSSSTSNVTLSPSPTTHDTDVFVYTGMDAPDPPEEQTTKNLITFEASSLDSKSSEVFVYEPRVEVLEKSPGANLFATELVDEDEEMPALDLGEVLSEVVVPRMASEFQQAEPETKPESEHNEPDEEEDATPKPTPISVKLNLPALSDDVVDDAHFSTMSDNIQLQFQDASSEDDSGMYTGEHGDPDFLPLPDSSLFKVDDPIQCEPPSWLKFDKVEDVSSKRSTPSQQTPTPPASPPPISPLRVFGVSNSGSKSMLPSLGGQVVEVVSSLRVSPRPQPSLTLVITQSPKTSTTISLRDPEDKENATPIALSSSSAKSIFGDRPEVVSLPPESKPLTPPRRILADIPSEANIDEDNSAQPETTAFHVDQDQEQKGEVQGKDFQPEYDEDECLQSPLPGTFPGTVSPITKSLALPASTTPSTIGERLASASDVLTPFPSSRTLVRSPLDIALAMQLRPGLGAGADPAWMVRFLMTMFGWFAVVVSGQAEF